MRTWTERWPIVVVLASMAAIHSAGASAQPQPLTPAPPSLAAAKVRVAAISFVPKKFQLEANAARLEEDFRTAKNLGAQIAVAPEGALDGYVVNEIIAGKTPAEKIRRVAIKIDGPVIARFQKLAKELKMCLVFGFAEQVDAVDSSEGDIYNAAVFIDHSGRICGKYHKMQFAEGYDPAWWFNRLGKQSRAFDTPFGRCGMLICNDRWNPQLARIPVLDGAQFLAIPSFGSRSTSQDQAVLARGKENNVPIIEANVGVTLIVDQGRIAAVDRKENHITVSEITIPRKGKSDPIQRDAVERDFLIWREQEMKRRLQKTVRRIQRIDLESANAKHANPFDSRPQPWQRRPKPILSTHTTKKSWCKVVLYLAPCHFSRRAFSNVVSRHILQFPSQRHRSRLCGVGQWHRLDSPPIDSHVQRHPMGTYWRRGNTQAGTKREVTSTNQLLEAESQS